MGDTRIPTSSLRFVQRLIQDPGDSMLSIKVRVLQQMFLTPGGKQFWEDVPLIDEPGDRE